MVRKKGRDNLPLAQHRGGLIRKGDEGLYNCIVTNSDSGEHWLVSTTAYTLHTQVVLERNLDKTHVLLWFLGALAQCYQRCPHRVRRRRLYLGILYC
jgi:hypothetical protein